MAKRTHRGGSQWTPYHPPEGVVLLSIGSFGIESVRTWRTLTRRSRFSDTYKAIPGFANQLRELEVASQDEICVSQQAQLQDWLKHCCFQTNE